MVTLDTYNKVLTLGTAPNLKKQIKVKVPQEKLSEIYDLLIEDRVQGYDGDYKGTILEETPNTKFSIKTTIRGRTKIVNGDSTTASYTKRFEIEKLLEFRDYMIEYIESLPEYKELK